MFETVSLVVKYIFVLIVYLFIFAIIRMIYLDIKSMSVSRANVGEQYPYLKLLNRRESLKFKVEEAYSLDRSISIGREASNNVVIADPFLSKRHAFFLVKDGQVFIEDLNSRNGTFLNGEKINQSEKIELSDGDKIRMGNLEFLFRIPKKVQE
jgi:hypothetical protein